MLPIVVIVAPSRSGKDSLQRLLSERLDAQGVPNKPFKWAGHVKRMTELTYGLPEGSLETNEVRNSFVPGTTTTYLDVLVSLYHCQDGLADLIFWKRPPLNYLRSAESKNFVLISTDTRCRFEAGFTEEENIKHGRPIITVRLMREGNTGLSSDVHLVENFHYLKKFSSLVIDVELPDDPKGFISNLNPIAKQITDFIVNS